jgi:hypothetical protein
MGGTYLQGVKKRGLQACMCTYTHGWLLEWYRALYLKKNKHDFGIDLDFKV